MRAEADAARDEKVERKDGSIDMVGARGGREGWAGCTGGSLAGGETRQTPLPAGRMYVCSPIWGQGVVSVGANVFDDDLGHRKDETSQASVFLKPAFAY